MAPIGITEGRLRILREAFAQMQEDEAYRQMMTQLGENTEYLDGADYEALRIQQSNDYQELAQSLLDQ